MPVTIEAEPFTTALRERFALKLEDKMTVGEVLSAFDRATTEAVFQSLNGQHQPLSPQQRAAITRAKNRKERQRELDAEERDQAGVGSPATVGGGQ